MNTSVNIMFLDWNSLKKSLPAHRKQDIDFLNETLKMERKFIAVHHECADGLTAGAAILSHYRATQEEENVLVLPIDYGLLKNQEVLRELQKIEWHGIVDLEPFSKKVGEFYIDHHLSSISKLKQFKRIYFDAEAPSGAFLVEKSGWFKINEKIKPLIQLTTITDTAGFKLPPPTENFEFKSNLDEQVLAWALADLTPKFDTITDAIHILMRLAENGIEALKEEDLTKIINTNRSVRRKALEIARSLEPKEFVAVINDIQSNDVPLKPILYDLLERGSKVAVALTVDNKLVKISFRVNRHLPPELKEKYRVDLLAKKLNGGGHMAASGAAASTIEEALDVILPWVKEKHLSYEIYDIRRNVS